MRYRLSTRFLIRLWLTLIAGAYLTALAVSSVGLTWIAWVSLLPLFIGIKFLSPVRAGAAGLVFGVSFYILSITVVGSTIPASIGSLLLLAAGPAIYATLGSAFTRRYGFSPLAMGVGWIGLELALQPLGLGGSLLATGLDTGTVAFVIAESLGYAVLAAMIAYAVAWLLQLAGVFRKCCALTRLFKRSGDRSQRAVPTPSSGFFTFYLQPSQPRAPPFLPSLR